MMIKGAAVMSDTGRAQLEQAGPPGPPEPTYEDLFPSLWRKAYVVAYRVLGSPAAAEDVAQESLTRAYASWPRAARSPYGWVAKVAYNLAIDHIRRQSRTHSILEDVADRPAATSAVEDRLDLMSALQRLPRRQRQVIVLRYLGEQSEVETAQALRVRVTTVRKHAARGIATLGRQLSTELQGS